MILLGQAKPLQMFLPFMYDMKTNETLFDKVSNGKVKLLPGVKHPFSEHRKKALKFNQFRHDFLLNSLTMNTNTLKYICKSNIVTQMKQTTVFVTYNPGNDFDANISCKATYNRCAVHGFNMLMPDRFHNNGKISNETAYRIKSSDYFILFSTSALTQVVLQEVNTAFAHLKDKSKVVIIYNKVKNLKHI